MPLRNIRPVTEYLRLQDRFKHLFTDDPRAREELEHLQELANHNIEVYGLRSEAPDRFDSEGSDTVSRGGMRTA
jgi:pyruvate ferredoxin oxidoreductase beta subunit